MNRYTVKEAAEVLGISPEAIRARLFRGTLERETGEDGTVYVLLRDDQTQLDADQSSDRMNDQSVLVEHLDSEVAFLRAELQRREELHREESRRKDSIIAALTSRIPELPAATTHEQDQGHRESNYSSPRTDAGTTGRVETPAPQTTPQPSIWRRIFGR